MNKRQPISQICSFALTLCVLTGTSTAHGAELNISNVPLFLDSGVDPNILMVIDDSGSMDSMVLLPAEARAAHNDDEQVVDYQQNGWDRFDWTPDSDQDVRRLCTEYNKLAFDPSKTYTPWAGVDSGGNTYGDQSLTSARYDPYSSNTTTDLSGNVFFTWQDSNSNGTYDSGECPSLPEELVEVEQPVYVYSCPSGGDLRSQGDYYYCRISRWDSYPATETQNGTETVIQNNGFTETACREDPQCFLVSDLDATGKQNYANWYSYYRMRDYVAKKATLALIDSSSARMGLGTLHNNNSVGTEIKDMDDGDDSTTTDVTDKAALMRNVSRINPGSGTPLRQALYEAGEYYKSGDGTLMDLSNISSPILSAANGGQCQQNFTIMMTDGYANGSLNNSVDNRDMDGGTGTNDTEYDGGIYADEVSNTIADVAMKYYEEDLSNLTDGVPNSNGGTAKMHQHMVTYTVAFGIQGNLTCQPGITGCNESWPTSISYNGSSASSIDDVWHAAVNGRGQYLNAADPQGLIDDLQEAMDSIDARTSSSAAVAANSTTLNQGTVVYQALFNTGDWHGNLRSLPVSVGATDTRSACADIPAGAVCTVADWNASTVLSNQNYDSGRTILTYNPASAETKKGIPFRWPSDYTSPGTYELSSSQAASLLGNATSGDEQNYGQALVNFLRGDSSNEGSGYDFRERSTPLGDIINSAPAFVGPPRFNYPDTLETAAYSTYRSGSAASRTKMVYVGANDGMLHGFDISNGQEKLAYVPAAVYNNLENLSENDYNSNHRFYVDGSPTVGDAYFGSAWRSVLVGGMNAGGQGVYALDVTNPNKFTETQNDIDDVVLWEYTDADLGYTYSQPDIVKMNDGTWAAIFGNGYNNTEADGSASTTGYAYLYVVNLQTGALIKKISTDTGSVTTPNGLASATPVDTNGDYKVDYIYAGDLQGNLWKFDVSSTSSSNWDVIKASGTPAPLFTAKAPEAGYPAQPITTRPSVAFHPDAQRDGVMVYFGTGRYIDEGDSVASGNTQTFYGIWDDFANLPPTFSGNRNEATPDYLKQVIQSEPTVTGTGYSFTLRITSDNAIDWTQHHGWYIDLVNTGVTPQDNRGERQVTNSIVRGDRIIFSTLMPNDIACDFGGNSFLMELSAVDGGRLGEPPLDINNDGNIDTSDLYNGTIVPSGISQSGIITEPSIIGSPDGDKEFKLMNSSTGSTVSVVESPPGGLTGKRKSWTEIFQ